MNFSLRSLTGSYLIVVVLLAIMVFFVTPVSADKNQTPIIPDSGKFPLPSPVPAIVPVWTSPVSLNDSAYPNERPLSISDGGESLVGSSDHTINYLDRNGTILWNYHSLEEIRNIMISGDGSTVVAGFWDNSLLVFDRNGNQTLNIQFDTWIPAIAVSEDGRYIVVGEMNRTLSGGRISYFDRGNTILWNYTTPVPIVSIAVSDDGRYVVAGGLGYDSWLSPSDNDVYFMDRTGRLLWVDRTLGGNSVAMTHDAGYVAVASKGRNRITLFNREGISQWSYKTGADITDVSLSSSGDKLSIVINPDQSLSNQEPSKILTYDRKGKLLWTWPLAGTNHDVISSSGISGDGNIVALGTTAGKIVLLDGEGTVNWTFDARSRVKKISLSRDGQYVAATTENELFFFNRWNNQTIPMVMITPTAVVGFPNHSSTATKTPTKPQPAPLSLSLVTFAIGCGGAIATIQRKRSES